MKLAFLLVVGIIFLGTSVQPASAATLFYGETGPNTVTIYASSDKPMRCVLTLEFWYTRKEKFRSIGATQCSKATEIQAGKHQKICGITHPAIIDPAIAGPVVATHCE